MTLSRRTILSNLWWAIPLGACWLAVMAVGAWWQWQIQKTVARDMARRDR